MKKGITPIIAIIVLLLITVALAGAAWTYLSSFWAGMTARNIQVTDAFCVAGVNATIFVRNTGTQDVLVSDVSVINTSNGNVPTNQQWFQLTGNVNATRISPGQTVRYQALCGSSNFCSFRFMAWGRSSPASVQC